jgi:hypothetical protein
MENSNDTSGNQTRDLLACSAVPQTTVLLRAPRYTYYISNLFMLQYNNHHYEDVFLRSDVPTATLLKILISWEVILSCLVGTEQVLQNHTVFVLYSQEVQQEKLQKKWCYMGTDDTKSKLHVRLQAN